MSEQRMTKKVVALSLLMLAGCDLPPECANFHDGQVVKYKGEVVVLDFIDFKPYVILRGFGVKVECSCYDLEAL